MGFTGTASNDHFFLPTRLNDALGIADNGLFLSIVGASSVLANEAVTQGVTPYDCVFEIFVVNLTGDGHDAGSVNTWTLVNATVDTTFIMTVPPETIGIISLVSSFEISQFGLVTMRFNSDDAGTANYRGCGFGGRIIN